MKTNTIVLLAIGGGALYYFSQLGVAGATVQFVFSGVDMTRFPQLGIQVLVQNVSNATIQLAAMSGQATLNGNSLGNVAYFPPTPALIAPTSQQLVNFTANLNLLSLPSTIQNLINTPGSGAYNFAVTGNANINSLVIPFNLTYQLNS
jgi:hypothetical protein